MDVVVTSKKTARFIKNHKNELIVGGIVIVGGAIFGARLYKAGFLKGMASQTYAGGASCDFTVMPKLWEHTDGSKTLTAVLRHVGPSETGKLISSSVALEREDAMNIANEITEIFKEA